MLTFVPFCWFGSVRQIQNPIPFSSHLNASPVGTAFGSLDMKKLSGKVIPYGVI